MNPDNKSVGAELALSRESAALHRQSTDVAGLCKALVVKTALDIQGRKFVRVEGWSSIAVAHGFIPSIRSVEVTPSGTKAVAELKRISDGSVISAAEGFVGSDEPIWYGGPDTIWDKRTQQEKDVIRKKRPDYAIRAMAQTRAVSRVCRSAFSHVVVLMDANLDTTPAEEVGGPDDATDIGTASAAGGIDKEQEKNRERAQVDQTKERKPVEVPREVDPGLKAQFMEHKWEKVAIHFGAYKGKTLGELTPGQLKAWFNWTPKPLGSRPIAEDDKLLRAALDAADEELAAQS